MKANLITMLIQMALKVLGTDVVKDVVDSLIDKIEDEVSDSTNHWDDAIFLPICAGIRKGFDIPDDDD